MTRATKTLLKPTKIPWIGKIPEDWILMRSKFATKIIPWYAYKAEEYMNSGGIPILRIGDIEETISIDWTKQVPQKYLETTPWMIVKKGDILIALTGATIWKSSLYNLNDIVLLNQRVGIIRPTEKIDGKYLYFFVKSECFRKFVDFECYWWAQENISTGQIWDLLIPLPSLPTQITIAHFLDQKTEKISTLISNKKKLIDLLKEQKQSIIHRAVTKGINETMKMKDSEIPWIGEIPEGWKIVKLKYLGRIRSGDMIENTEIKPNWEYEVYGWNGFMGYSETYNISEISIIIGRVGAKCWNVRLINERKWISDNALILSLFNSDNYIFLSKLLEIMNLNTLSISNAQPLITGTVVMNQFVPFPSPQEQSNIIQHINQETSQINFAIEKIEKEIILIEEYRTSVIYQAVTGKITIS